MQYWLTRGAPAHKLLLGLASHGHSFTLSSAATGTGAPARGPGMPGPYTQQMSIWSYYEVVALCQPFGAVPLAFDPASSFRDGSQ